MIRIALFLLLPLLLAGCATPLPSAIFEPPARPFSVRDVQKNPGAHLSKEARWGGEILEVHNPKDHTDVLVLGRSLKKNGRPEDNGVVDGRFIARFSGFVDPGQLPEGRLLTVSGPVIAVETHKVGDYPYRYPVVQVVAWHLWPKPEPRYYYRDPWWPYYPGYPWYPHWW